MISIVAIANTVAMLPVFLVGSLAPFISADIPLRKTDLGIAVAIFFLSQAATALPSGRFLERVGTSACLVAASGGTAAVLLGYALAPNLAAVFVLAVFGGACAAASQVAGNAALARTRAPGNKALRFGITQASVPLATLLAGLAVPLIADRAGWRTGFEAAAFVSLVFAFGLRRADVTSERPTKRTEGSGKADVSGGGSEGIKRLGLLSAGWMFGSAAATVTAELLVTGAESVGLSVGFGGTALAFAGMLSVVVRVASGLKVVERIMSALSWVAVMLLAGCVGSVLLTIEKSAALFLVGGFLALGLGSGWQGVFLHSFIHDEARATRLSSLAFASGGLGAALGPMLFTVIAQIQNMTAAWYATGAVYVCAASFILAASRARGGHARS